MKSRRTNKRTAMCIALAFALTFLAACGDDDDSGSGTPTATATNTGSPAATQTPTSVGTPVATNTPAGAAVRGLLVVHRDVGAGAGDALGGVPELFADAVGPDFDRSLAHADWSVDGVGFEGVTDEFGRFSIEGLEPGEHTLQVHKTVGGDFMSFAFPFTVGDDGSAEVIAEVAWGRVRSTSIYTSEGREFHETRGPGGGRALTSAGRLVELADYSRTLVDDDGDGSFVPRGCDQNVWLCDGFGSCGEGRFCSCTASCPFCDDCGPPVCAFSGPYSPYRCDDDGSCQMPGDRCVCASSSPDTTDCPLSVCVPSCEPVEIESIEIYGPDEIIVGQRSALGASALISDGSAMDVTVLVDWSSSDEAVLTVDSWGTIDTLSAGVAEVVASLANLSSEPHRIRVNERPALVSIQLSNSYCDYPIALPEPGAPFPIAEVPDFFAPPICTQAVEVGGTIQFNAYGFFEGGYFEDISDEVSWQSLPESVGDIEAGLFTGRQEGAVTVSASLDGVVSDTRDVRVVAERSVVSINIYPDGNVYPIDFLGVSAGAPTLVDPCFAPGCFGGFLTVLVGDELGFHAIARYDIGGWEDVTDLVAWLSTDETVVSAAPGGVVTALTAGTAAITARLDEVESRPYEVRVVEEATVQDLNAYPEVADRVVEKGGRAYFRANAYYDLGFGRDVTAEATWRSSNEAIGGFDEPGVFTGRAAGNVTVWAQLDGVLSGEMPMEVFEQTDIQYCDPLDINRGTWTDGFNRVFLESDCDEYIVPGVVHLRFTVTEVQRPGGIFDPCLDLFAIQNGKIVRTIREEGCGEPFLAAGAPELDDAQLRYQLQAFWDLKDDAGKAVAPGTYRIAGRFYLYYDPVVDIEITVR